MTGPLPWAAPAAGGPVSGRVDLPGSKSLTARHLILAALTPGTTVLTHPLVSRDSLLMLEALTRLGVEVERNDDDTRWSLTPPLDDSGAPRLRGDVDIDCGLAGTVMRFVPAITAVAATGPVWFDGDPAARTRPMRPLLDALRPLGVNVRASSGDVLPVTIDGAGLSRDGRPLEVEVDASSSSQFVSALLLAAAGYGSGLTLRHLGRVLPSHPHIEMTMRVLREAGLDVQEHQPTSGQAAHLSWTVAAGRPRPAQIRVEPDLSGAAPFLAAAAVTGGEVLIRDWPDQTTQAGDLLRPILDRLGTTSALTPAGLVVRGHRDGRAALRGAHVDLHAAGELAPVVAALLALGEGPSSITGIAHLRGHETDRLAALQQELTRVGCTVDQLDDGLRIVPGPLRPALWHSYADHRMAMAGAVIALAVPGVQIEDSATTAKTFPGFEKTWEDLIIGEMIATSAVLPVEARPRDG